jgi:ComF family protein
MHNGLPPYGGRPIFLRILDSVAAAAALACDAALALVYPQLCEVCGGSVESRKDGVACRDCWRETRLFGVDQSLCWRCGAPTLVQVEASAPEDLRCHRCAEVSFAAARACGVYEKALRASVISLKRQPHVPSRLVSLMVRRCEIAPLDRATVIIPVPLHREREKQRGYNQASLLGEALAKCLRLPVLDRVLARPQHTELHRAGMDAKSRRASVAGAFEVITPRLVSDETVLLVDDVFTSGATVSACAGVLSAAGAREVLVLTLARPVM